MTKPADFTPITSSMIDGVRYDPNTRDLTLRFKNGAVHQYADVGADKHDAFVGSASPGAFYNAKIKGNHESKKL